jgi:apolipoprotein N-acyltransferase
MVIFVIAGVIIDLVLLADRYVFFLQRRWNGVLVLLLSQLLVVVSIPVMSDWLPITIMFVSLLEVAERQYPGKEEVSSIVKQVLNLCFTLFVVWHLGRMVEFLYRPIVK